MFATVAANVIADGKSKAKHFNREQMCFNAVVTTWGRIFQSRCLARLKTREGPRVGGLGPPGCGTVALASPRSAVGSRSRGAPSPHVREGPEVTDCAVSCATGAAEGRAGLQGEEAQARWPCRHCTF